MGVLRVEPAGLTTRQLAERIGSAKIDTVSFRLSRLADYGRIDKELYRRQEPVPGASRWYIWKHKAITIKPMHEVDHA